MADRLVGFKRIEKMRDVLDVRMFGSYYIGEAKNSPIVDVAKGIFLWCG